MVRVTISASKPSSLRSVSYTHLEGIEGARGNQDIGAELLRTATMLEHALGLGVDDTDKHGYTMIDDADRLADDLIAALVGGENDLAGGAEEEQALSLIHIFLENEDLAGLESLDSGSGLLAVRVGDEGHIKAGEV